MGCLVLRGCWRRWQHCCWRLVLSLCWQLLRMYQSGTNSRTRCRCSRAWRWQYLLLLLLLLLLLWLLVAARPGCHAQAAIRCDEVRIQPRRQPFQFPVKEFRCQFMSGLRMYNTLHRASVRSAGRWHAKRTSACLQRSFACCMALVHPEL